MKKYYLSLLLLMLVNYLSSQITIKGKVTDIKTNEPVKGVYVACGDNGTSTDFDGYYELKIDNFSKDTISYSYLGYETEYRKIEFKNQTINVSLKTGDVFIKEIRVSSKVNKALKIIENTQKKKHLYNIEKLNSYESENFTKIQVAVNNVSDDLKNKKLLKQVQGVFDTFSYLSEDPQRQVLPMFISENLSYFYFNKNPARTKEVIIASRIKGVGVEDGTFISQLMGSTFQQYNFNDNILPILEKNFVSPISTNSFQFYNYKYRGFTMENGKKIFKIEVFPKNPLDLVFSGYIWIEDSTFALTGVSLSITNKANLNFIEKLKITQEIQAIETGVYFPVKNRVLIDIAEISKNSAGMIGLFNSSSKNIIVNKERSAKFYDYPIKMNEDATMKSNEFWDTMRHEKLSEDEKRVMSKIDTLTNIKVVKTYVEIIDIAVNGYKSLGKFSLGPYALLYGYNVLEGHRIRVGAKTNYSFNKKITLLGYGAYGFSDQIWKYQGQIDYVISRKHWTTVSLSYKNDVEQIGVNDDQYGSSNLFTAVSIFAASQLNRAKESKFIFNREIIKGLQSRIVLQHKDYFFEPVKNFNFVYGANLFDTSNLRSNFTNATISTNIRWAPKEYYLQNDNERIKQSKPGGFALSVNYTRGIKGIVGSKFNYNRLTVSIEKGINFGYWGRTDMILAGTKIFERVPYPLLEVHRGNQSFIYTSSSYNLMNFFEFITDQSLLYKLEHHFNGAIFNRIPLLKKLKWREFVEGRAVYGTISQKNLNMLPQYDYNSKPVSGITNFINREPYVEVAYGIENIFKLLQVVAVHRLSHTNLPNARKFGVKVGMSISF